MRLTIFAAFILFTQPIFGQADLTVASLNTAGVVTDTQSLLVSGTIGVSIGNIGTASVSIPFRVLAWEDRNNNLRLDPGEPILGSLLYSAGVGINRAANVQLPLGGTVLFRGSPIAVQADSDNAIAESNESNNTLGTANSGFGALPDLTASLIRKSDAGFPSTALLTARIGNGGGNPVSSLAGRVVVGHDANTLGSNLAGALEERFAVNVAKWITQGKVQAKLLLLELNLGDPDHGFSSQVQQALTTDGFTVSIVTSPSLTLGQLRQYDAVFVNSSRNGVAIVDNTTLVQFVQQGGGVYLAGGVGSDPSVEAALWATFLSYIGLAFDGSAYNGLSSANITSSHPIFSGISQLASGNGQDIITLAARTDVQVFSYAGHNVYAAYDPNLIQNGGFEAGSPACPSSGFKTLAVGDKDISPWAITAQTIDYVGVQRWQPGEGTCSLDLTGTPGAGTIEQAISTVQGHTYEGRFLLAGNPECGPAVKGLLVTAAGGSTTFTFDGTGKSATDMGYIQKVWDFVASSSSTVIGFQSLVNDTLCGPVIDAVEVRELVGAGQGGPVAVSFYLGDPASGGVLLGTTHTSKALAIGEYEDVSVTWNNPASGLHPIVVVADDDGTGHGAINESNETNNKAGANVLLGLGPFTAVDDLTARFKANEVDLHWGAISGATGYNVYRRFGSASATLLRAGLAATSLADMGLTNGTIYYYSVRWLDSKGKESGDGTEASATPTPAAATDTPPTILSTPTVRAAALTAYFYQIHASDPDKGDTLTYSLVSPPAGMTITSAAGLITWTPSIQQGGYTRIKVEVRDKKGHLATQSYSLFVDVQIVNQPPVITSTPIKSAISGQPYGYQVLGRDPQNGLLFYALDAGPTGMTINQSTGLVQWTPTRAQVGSQNVTLHATNFAGLSIAQTFAISVARGNKAPQFTSTPVTSARISQLYGYQSQASDPENDPIRFSLATAPSGMTVNATTGVVEWTPTAAQLGSQNVSLRVADDSGLNSLQNFTITVRPPNQPPTITSSAITSAQTSELYSYQVVATDPDLPNDALTFSLTVFPTGMTIAAGSGLIQWTPAPSLLNTTQSVTVQVKDFSGATATQSFQIRVTAPSAVPPTVSIATPLNGAQITNDTVITGTATDDNLKNWILEYQVSGAQTWTTLSAGTSPVVNGPLGTLPATLLANNPYRLRLTAFDPSQSNSTTIEVNVNTGQLKLGDFTLSFEDIRVPGFTFPISILRKYDSKRPAPGDFGPGWRLGFSEVDIQVNANYDVFITLPDGRRVKFTSTPTPIGLNVFNTGYTAQSGVVDTLQNLDCPQVFGTPGTFLCDGFQPWNPQNYLLTTKEGLKYTINAQAGVQRLEDRTGNFIQIGTSGITSNFGRNVTFQRDAGGKIISMTEPSGGQVKYGYDANGRLSRFTDQAGNATTFSYEYAQFPNYLTKIVDPLGRPVTRSVFDAGGRLIAQCDANGNVTTLAGCVQFTSQPATRILTTLNGRGFKADLFLDAQGNVVTERHWLDSTNFLDTVRTYDANNNLLTEKDPAGNTKSYTYDARNNKLTDTDQGGHKTTYTYNSCDKVVTQTDPAGNVTQYTYDAACNLRFVTDALNNTTEYRYNAAGQRTQFIDPLGSTWTWAYDASGLLTSLTDPFGKATTFNFNLSGDLLSRTDRIGRQIAFQYDVVHHLTKETWSNGRVTNFGYSSTGQLTSASDPDSALSMVYDGLGRLQSIDNQGTPGAPRVLVSYTYDQDGNVTSVQDSLGGTTAYTYDALDRLSRVTQSGSDVQEKRVDMVYDTTNSLTQLQRFGNLAGTLPVANTLYSYDCSGCASRVSAIRHRKASDNSVLHDLTFVRDALGNITSLTDAEGVHAYSYDVLRRLTSSTHPTGGIQPNEFYTYDAVGNRLTSHLSDSYVYSWQTTGKGNRLLQDSRFNYTYDDEGNLTRKTDRAGGSYTDYNYDHRNRMIAAIQRNSAAVETGRSESLYDGLNRRIRTLDAGQASFFGYDGLNPTLKLSSTGAVISRRLYSRNPDGILGDEYAAQTRWFLTDQVGTVRDLTDNVAVGIEHYVYNTFGMLALSSNPSIVNDLLYTGREFNSTSGYFRARFYDQGTGRFTQEDSVLSRDYLYAGNGPTVFSDPLGLDLTDYALFLGTTAATLVCTEKLHYNAAVCATGVAFAATLGLIAIGAELPLIFASGFGALSGGFTAFLLPYLPPEVSYTIENAQLFQELVKLFLSKH